MPYFCSSSTAFKSFPPALEAEFPIPAVIRPVTRSDSIAAKKPLNSCDVVIPLSAIAAQRGGVVRLIPFERIV